MSESLLEQGKAIVSEDDSFVAGVDKDGAQIGLNKSLGRGWAIIAWAQQAWSGAKSYGAALRKKF